MRQHALTHKTKDGTTNNGGSGGAGSGSSGSNQASPSHSTAGSMAGDMSATFKALSKSALGAGGVIPGGSDTGKFNNSFTKLGICKASSELRFTGLNYSIAAKTL